MFSSVEEKQRGGGGGRDARRPVVGGRPLPAKDAVVLEQDELHYLVLVDHVDRNVARLRLGPQQRGTEHDGHALGSHAVGLAMVNHPGGRSRIGLKMECVKCFRIA